jgi:biofilm PGA synthesis protein PgaA
MKILILQLLMFPLCLLVAGVHVASASSNEVSQEREQAVIHARQGQVQEAVQTLTRLHQQWPDNAKVSNDLIVVSGWAGQLELAKTVFEEQAPAAYPVYVRYGMVNTYRNLQQPAAALALLDDLLKQEPENTGWLLRKALLLIDSGQTDQAEDILDGLVQKVGGSKDLHLATAYLHETQKEWFSALIDYQNALEFIPGDNTLLTKEILALKQLHAPALALKKNQDNPQLLNPQQFASILTERAAQLLLWSTEGSEDYKETRLFSLYALSLQLQALELLRSGSKDPGLRREILLDMVISLRNLRRHDNLLTLYNILLAAGPIPDYITQARADSLLATHHPDESRVIYQELTQKDPQNYEASFGLFYSFVEEEDFTNAYQTIDGLSKREPPFFSYWDSKAKQPNSRYLDLQVASIQARFYGDQLDEAWERINVLVNRAPRNNWLLEVRGQISNNRAWPRQARDDFHLAELLQPKSLDALAGKTASLIHLQEYEQARPLLRELQSSYPREHATLDVEELWYFARRPTYFGDIVFSNSSGPDLNGEGMLATAEVISSPINDFWKLHAGYRYAWSEIIEGEETIHRSNLGLAYDRANWDVLGTFTYNDSTLKEAGGKITINLQPNDFWNISLSGERFAESTPLRALYHEIRADAANAAVAYRFSEMRELSGSIQGSNFTDGNNRVEAGARFRQRLIDIPHLDIDGRLDLYGSKNSKNNAPYYNPEHDFSLEGSAHMDHVFYRHYDHLLAHQLDVGYGFYNQKRYGSDWIGHIRYEHRYRFFPWLEMLAGFEFGQNVYDGHSEPYRLARFMINGKF